MADSGNEPVAASTAPPVSEPNVSTPWQKPLIFGGVLVGVVLAAYFVIPWIHRALNTVSTDDAYVNGHVTFVAARVPGQVSQVLVDDNMRVKKGDVLVRLDREPYLVQLEIKKAAVAAAETDLLSAQAQVRGLAAQTRANRFKLEHAIENVNNQVANLRAVAATLSSRKANLELAQENLKRGELLAPKGTLSKEEFDLRKEAVKVATAGVEQTLQQAYAIRVGLGLPAVAPDKKELTDVPADLDQTFSSVRQAVAELMQSATQIGYFPETWNATPKELVAAFYKQDPKGNLDRIFESLFATAPIVKQADAKLLQTRRDLEQAELNLRYTDVLSEIDGVVTRRNVNPGNNVTAGQSLMAVRSLTEIWIDANFKETQLADLQIGQRVLIEVDMYGSHREFEGRITGFTMGTGQTLALLPPQNATGNFVKIVQRLPVKIELTKYDSDAAPLFVGLSVSPYVYIRDPLIGDDPGKGKSLQPYQTGKGQIVNPAIVTRRTINPWIVAVAVVIPTFMEVLDTTIANVALRYIAGGLSAAVTDAEWVLTSYLAANATILPISGWISAHLGRRNYFLLSIAVFTIASALCGVATSLEQIILFRVLQGLAGGGLQPSSQGVLLDAFPPEKQGAAQTMFGIAALLAPVVGPTLGGYLTVFWEWRWIFYINIPVGILAFVMCYFVVRDPDELIKQRAELRRRPINFDYIGLGLLALAIAAWEVLVSKGQEWDWLGDPFWRVQVLLIVFLLGSACLFVWESRIANPVVNFRPLAERSFSASCVIIFCAFGVLYGASTTLPALLQSLFGYDAYLSGLVLSPAGVFSVLMLLVVGTLLGRGLDARWLIVCGLLIMSAGCYWTSQLNLDISPAQVIWPRVVLIVGLSMIFAPLNVAAFKYIPHHLRAAAVGLFALLRNEGASVGTSVAQTCQQRREQFHLARLDDGLHPLNPQVQSWLEEGQRVFLQQTGDPVQAQQMALQSLDNLRQQQAASLAYFDVFWLCAALGVGLVVMVLFMKRSAAEKGEHIAAE